MIVIDEELRTEMGQALVDGDYDLALRLSVLLDSQVVSAQKQLLSMSHSKNNS